MGINGKHLILVPKSCLGNWMNEFKQWAPCFKAFKFHGDKETRLELRCTLIPLPLLFAYM